ncbi:hypothetical protein ACIRS1_06700 [Kitasatospora sp. NPDC101176]|uniref:WapI family immunity protein n=1 Tax=Kitasatospora sp. NPDC101176 TaxID=3364099 RepID=UPI0038293613
MLLASHQSAVELRPLRYQFSATSGDPYDDNWLVIQGQVATPTGRWSFQDPSLLTDECRGLSRWLRAVAAGRVAVTVPDPDGEPSPSLTFLEPNLAFSLAGRSGGRSLLHVHLSLEAAPPWQCQDGDGSDDEDEGFDLYRFAVELDCGDDALLRAADAWDRDLSPFPSR